MIEVSMKYGEEEYEVLADLLVDSEKEKKGRRIWKVILIILGVFQLGNGVYNFISSSFTLCGFCLVTGAAAFFLAFGGERFLVRSAVLRRTRKLKDSADAGVRRLTFDKNETTISSSAGSGTYGWDAYSAYGEIRHYLWIRRNDNRYVLVDMNQLSRGDADTLRKYCAAEITGSNGVNQTGNA